MFTGIISHIGTIQKITPYTNAFVFEIKVDEEFAKNLKVGDSISHSGACLSVLSNNKDSYTIQLIPETLSKTSFASSKVGDELNLEKSIILGSRLDGHIVQGHIDGAGEIAQIDINDESWIVTINPPQDLIKYIAYKGSICVNGVSLTVSSRNNSSFQVSLISHTLTNTNLSKLKPNDKVNLEIDVIARYIENMIPNYN